MKAIINIPLPFKLPFKEGLKVVSGYENNKYFSIELEHYYLYLSEDKKNFDESNNTQLIVTYVYDDKDVPAEVENLLRGIIYNCLSYVNDFLTSIRFTLDLNYVKDITVYDLPDYLPIEVDGNTYLYITSPMKLIEESEILPSKKLQLAQKMMATWEKYPEVALVDRFYSSAKHSIETENFLSAIIELQTSFEIFIRNTMRLVVKIDGQRQNRPQKEIEKEIEEKKNIAFRNLIEQHLSRKLGEKLDFFKHPVIYKWYKHLYKIRNDIVHSGKYFVTNEEAQAAYDSYVEVRNYIADKLVEKKYLSKNGNVDLKLFEEVYSNPKKHKEIRQKLEKYNLVPKDLEFPPR
ncbi:HEPN domain-containing protein [Peribacillus frigoritolerans]|uniref:hypothetical protein n=1 Tax=Peribacillus frigoritolerans TaxID=450367 RepID=UPI002E250973|nr:HEPN domain-containing protein [Peribacillus frigoritolerans]